jgi:acetyltransferase-like isoleucine patch superfamily enzyme
MRLTQYFIRDFRPRFLALLTRLVYAASNVHFGSGLRCDSIPKIMIDKQARLDIGDRVELRRNVEIRVHQQSEIRIGSNVRIDRGVRLLATNKAKLELEEGVRLGLYTVFNGGDSIRVGAKSLISGFVYLQTSMHGFKDRQQSVQSQGYDHAPIELGRDCWLGTHVVVLPGVKLGAGVVVGSNAVVTKSVDNYKVIGGVPATVLKERA